MIIRSSASTQLASLRTRTLNRISSGYRFTQSSGGFGCLRVVYQSGRYSDNATLLNEMASHCQAAIDALDGSGYNSGIISYYYTMYDGLHPTWGGVMMLHYDSEQRAIEQRLATTHSGRTVFGSNSSVKGYAIIPTFNGLMQLNTYTDPVYKAYINPCLFYVPTRLAGSFPTAELNAVGGEWGTVSSTLDALLENFIGACNVYLPFFKGQKYACKKVADVFTTLEVVFADFTAGRTDYDTFIRKLWVAVSDACYDMTKEVANTIRECTAYNETTFVKPSVQPYIEPIAAAHQFLVDFYYGFFEANTGYSVINPSSPRDLGLAISERMRQQIQELPTNGVAVNSIATTVMSNNILQRLQNVINSINNEHE